jgi:hypothetical protein
MRADPQTVCMANGSAVISISTVKLHLHIQKYTSAVTLRLLPLVPGFGVVLGDDWAQRHQLLVDYGVSALSQAPSLLLRSKRLRLLPMSTPTVASGSSTLECHLISAKQAERLLVKRRSNCKSPFLVLVSDASETLTTPNSEASSTDPRLTSFLNSYSDVFEQPTMGLVDVLAPPSVPTVPDVIPPNRPAFRLSLLERQESESQVTKMLEKGWIQPSSSPYGAPVLFVPKPDGSLRMCIDYRALNKITPKNKYPLPRIEDLLDNLSGARYFSSLDLTSVYHHLQLPASDLPKTAFITHFGKFEWRVLPMGLSNAPAVFQSVMNRLFSPYLNKCVFIYLDEILIFSKTAEEHYAHLSQVLSCLRQHGLKAKMSKCDLFIAELKFLGHIVSANGMNETCPF